MRLPFIVALALAAALPAFAQDVLPAPLRIMPIGDSITEGGDGTGGFRRPLFDRITADFGMPNFVGARSMRQSDPVEFLDHDQDGYSAYRIEQITTGEGFWNAQSVETRLAAWDPAIVTIHAGTNDAQQDFFFWGNERRQLPPAIDRLDELVSRVVAFNPEIYVIVAQIIPANKPASKTTRSYIRRLNAQIPAMVAKHQARGERVSMVDMYTPMLAHPNPDGIHPDAAGYAVMAQVWYQGMLDAGALQNARNPDPGRAWGVHLSDRFSTTSSTPWTLQPNLVRAGSATLADTLTTGYFGKHAPALLNDGSLHAFTDDHDYESTTTFTLATDAAPDGYDIGEIRSDAGEQTAANGDERAHQSYEVWWSSVDAPDTFVELGAFHHVIVNTAERASQLEIAHADGRPLARRVAKIRFHFTQPPLRQYGFFGIDTPTPYRELEVIGRPSP